MKRHYYISNDLDVLKAIEQQLESAGITPPQIHVLSEDDSGLAAHDLHPVEAVLKKDVVHGTELGAMVGVVGASLILLFAWFSGLTAAYTWVPAVFLAVIVLGFCTWEGGLIGIGEPHVDFRKFQNELRTGKHVLFVDVDPDQEGTLGQVTRQYPELAHAGEGSPTPRWVVGIQNKFARFMQTAP